MKINHIFFCKILCQNIKHVHYEKGPSGTSKRHLLLLCLKYPRGLTKIATRTTYTPSEASDSISTVSLEDEEDDE